ncbi:MAG: hypothetical protein ACQETH_08620 [Candidatus Rifleibacteriota bacterium]
MTEPITRNEKIKRCSRLIIAGSIFITIILIALFFIEKQFYAAFIIGYAVGIIGFFSLTFTFSAIDKLPEWFRIIAVLSSSFKLLFILAIAFILKYMGFSILQLIFGLLTSQFIIISTILIIVYTTRKNVENNIEKEN